MLLLVWVRGFWGGMRWTFWDECHVGVLKERSWYFETLWMLNQEQVERGESHKLASEKGSTAYGRKIKKKAEVMVGNSAGTNPHPNNAIGAPLYLLNWPKALKYHIKTRQLNIANSNRRRPRRGINLPQLDILGHGAPPTYTSGMPMPCEDTAGGAATPETETGGDEEGDENDGDSIILAHHFVDELN